MPRVSLAIPVFNGENYLSQTIESILSQTFSDFELIISDNASTDNTESICRNYIQRDSRIKFFRNDHNLGAAPNFNRCVQLSRCDYFKWAAHDDICLPDYLKYCVEILDSDPGIVLCHTRTQIIDADGKRLDRYSGEENKYSSNNAIDRFGGVIGMPHFCATVFGLIRRDALLKTSLIDSYIGSDRVILADLALYGRIVHVPSVQFLSRDHAGRSIRSMDVRARGQWFDTARPSSGRRVYARVLVEYGKVLLKHPLGFWDRLRGFWLVLENGWSLRRLVLSEFFRRA